MKAVEFSSLLQEKFLKIEWVGYEVYDILPMEQPAHVIVRQEYSPDDHTLWIMQCGRFNTETEAFDTLCAMLDYYRIEAGWCFRTRSVRPAEIELYQPDSGESFLLGLDSTFSYTACLN